MKGYAIRILEAVETVNNTQRLKPLNIVQHALTEKKVTHPIIAVLGLNCESNSDDMSYVASRLIVLKLLRMTHEARV